LVAEETTTLETHAEGAAVDRAEADSRGLTPMRSILVGAAAGALFYVACIPLSAMIAHLVANDSPDFGSLGLRVIAGSTLCISPLVAVSAGGMANHGRSLRSLSDTAWRAGRASGLVFVTCVGWLGGMYAGALLAEVLARIAPSNGIDNVLTLVMCAGAVSAFAALLSVARDAERASRRRLEHRRVRDERLARAGR
jgi:hypothetical protein